MSVEKYIVEWIKHCFILNPKKSIKKWPLTINWNKCLYTLAWYDTRQLVTFSANKRTTFIKWHMIYILSFCHTWFQFKSYCMEYWHFWIYYWFDFKYIACKRDIHVMFLHLVRYTLPETMWLLAVLSLPYYTVHSLFLYFWICHFNISGMS